MFYAYWIFMILFLFICGILILLVLIQKGRGGGLSSAFGGAGGNTAFGAKTGDVLTWATSVVFAIFIVLAIVLNLVAERFNKSYQAARLGQTTAIPVQTPGNSGQ
jgi:preprotein translocase subunit SecG